MKSWGWFENSHVVGVGLLLVCALGLRFAALDRNPAGFFRDEADKGYTAYCLITTGQDQTGKPYPWFVRSLNVTTSAVYQYLDIPFVYGLGMNEWAVRMPAAFAGSASVAAAYLLARVWWGKRAGLWAGWFVCLSPWSLLLSRWANQSILLTAWIPMALYFFTRGQKNPFPSRKDAVISSLWFLIALYTYAPARLFVPVLAMGMWCVAGVSVWKNRHAWKPCFIAFTLFFLVFTAGSLPLAHHLLFETEQSGARLSNITILHGQPWTEVVWEWMRNYALHLSPAFLFLHGDENLRHNTAVFGQLHGYLFPLLILGLIRAVRRHTWRDQMILLWFLCFPISAACTRESIPHALRSVFAVPTVHVLAAYGIIEFQHLTAVYRNVVSPKLKNALITLWIGAVILLSSIHVYDLFWRYPVYSALEWEYGYKSAITWWQDQRQKNERVVVSGMAEYPQWFFLFYDRVDPRDWIEHHRIEGVTFIPLGHDARSYFIQAPEQKTYYLLRPHELPNYRPVKSIVLPGFPPSPVWKWLVVE